MLILNFIFSPYKHHVSGAAWKQRIAVLLKAKSAMIKITWM